MKEVERFVIWMCSKFDRAEIEVIIKKDKRLLQSKNYSVFLADAPSIPNIIQEIGRLRETTFREVGEGTNKSLDLDRFDNFYKHLFLWDKTNKKIVGAYRMGLGSDIFKTYGIEGFYEGLEELTEAGFDIREEDIGRQAMEESFQLGRAGEEVQEISWKVCMDCGRHILNNN